MLKSIYYSTKKGSLRIAYHKLTRGPLFRSAIIRKFFSQNGPHFLQLGGGYHLIREKNWINGDIIAGDIFLDATKRLPFEDGSLDAVFAEQFLEHISLDAGIGLLGEVNRCLKPGGIIRFSTPDLEGLVSVYQGNNSVADTETVIERHMRIHCGYNQNGISTVGRVFNDNFRLWGHKFIYDRSTVEKVLKQTGYDDLQWKAFGESSVPELNYRERHADVEWMKSAYQLIFEAKKAVPEKAITSPVAEYT